jgi:hypothetical protein
LVRGSIVFAPHRICPSRRGGPRRVEVESENGGKVDGTWVLHNYSHGDGGFRSSVGCAEEIVRLVKGLVLDNETPEDNESPGGSEPNENPFDNASAPVAQDIRSLTERRIPMVVNETLVLPNAP